MHTHLARQVAKRGSAGRARGADTVPMTVENPQCATRASLLPFDFDRIPILASGEASGVERVPALPIQKKLLVGSTDDPLEAEADAVARQVMRSSTQGFQLQRERGVAPEMQKVPSTVHAALRGPGAPLDAPSRRFFEQRFGYDFSRVRVHTGPLAAESAGAVQARAYTVGQDIVFGAGQFAPGSEAGQRLLAHELAHTVQQRRGFGTVLRREPKTGNATQELPPLEPIAQRIALLARGENQAAAASEIQQGAGPVVSVVRDSQTGEIYVGLNMTNVQHQADIIEKRIREQVGRIAKNRVQVVHTIEPGEHAEVHALDRAIADREQRTGRPVTDADMATFELHNVWLRGVRAGTTAARCEHCAHITRGVEVTNSLFHAEGGVSGEIHNDTVLPDEPKVLKGSGGGGQGGAAASEGASLPLAGRTAPVNGVPSSGGATARDATREILGKNAAIENLEFAARRLYWALEVTKFVDILETIAKSISMAAATLAHKSPYFQALEDADAFARRAKAIDDEYDAINLKDELPRKGDLEWDSEYSLYQLQLQWYLAESKLTEALESVEKGRKNVREQMQDLRDVLKDKEESLIFAMTSLPWADVYLFGDAARQIGKSLEDADTSLKFALNSLKLQQGFARVAIKTLEIRLRELGAEGVVDVDIDTADLPKAGLSNFTMKR